MKLLKINNNIYVYIHVLPYVRNPESTREILQTRPERRHRHIVEIDCTRGDQSNLELNATCTVNGCQEKDAGVLFRLNYSIYQHALALEVILVSDGVPLCLLPLSN